MTISVAAFGPTATPGTKEWHEQVEAMDNNLSQEAIMVSATLVWIDRRSFSPAVLHRIIAYNLQKEPELTRILINVLKDLLETTETTK